MKFSRKDLDRYSKQIILKKFGIIGQKKIMSSKVLIIGMGGLGCPLTIYLSALGVGTIGIVDDDKIELSNLNRQIIYNYNDIGRYKVEIARKRIKSINKNISVKSYKLRLNKNNISKIFDNFNIICDGTDNFETRLLINDFCLKKRKILISAAVQGFDGQIFKFDFNKKTPCFRCFMPEHPQENYGCESQGVTPTLTGMVGTLQANEVLNSILNKNSKKANKMIILNSMNMSFRKVKLSKNKKCKNKC
tara:strand:- start:200 stop:943 length:744 start_codon:yes stop_codon:yes gene_type:complete